MFDPRKPTNMNLLPEQNKSITIRHFNTFQKICGNRINSTS
uniref:Uncharacterized protein n=1 Tax=Arundo donax TaxID=35708 RepID=A0A0A9A6T4_ARUDO